MSVNRSGGSAPATWAANQAVTGPRSMPSTSVPLVVTSTPQTYRAAERRNVPVSSYG
jgi:hypothetical protein